MLLHEPSQCSLYHVSVANGPGTYMAYIRGLFPHNVLCPVGQLEQLQRDIMFRLLDLPNTHSSLCSKLPLLYEPVWQRKQTVSGSVSLQGEVALKTFAWTQWNFSGSHLVSESKHIRQPRMSTEKVFLACFGKLGQISFLHRGVCGKYLRQQQNLL